MPVIVTRVQLCKNAGSEDLWWLLLPVANNPTCSIPSSTGSTYVGIGLRTTVNQLLSFKSFNC